MLTNELASRVREFGIAATFWMLAVMTVFFGFYLTRAWFEIKQGARTWAMFHSPVNQAAIGWFTTSAGATIKNGMALFVLEVDPRPVGSLIPSVYVGGTLIALWGMVCLMNALTRGNWYRGQWLMMVVGAVVFGLVFVLT